MGVDIADLKLSMFCHTYKVTDTLYLVGLIRHDNDPVTTG